LPVQAAVSVTGVFTTGFALLGVSVQDTAAGDGLGVGAGAAACQLTIVVAGALVPAAFVAVTVYVLGPALAEAVVHELVVPGQPVHA
jgi:hypothetical protein